MSVDSSLEQWQLACPNCGSRGLAFSGDAAQCGDCRFVVTRIDGIWRFISEDRLEHFREFLEKYTKVRVAEGRGSYTPAILRSLPRCPTVHPLAGQWAIRAKSYARLAKLFRAQLQPGNRILDLGAGTGWLCHQLRLQNYEPCAIDLSVDAYDGLGAAQHFDPPWPRMQAEYDRIPIADETAHAVIFNASFHYCTDQQVVLEEAIRVLVPGGLIVIVDSPIYARPSSGEQMLEEQQEYFENLIGERSDSLNSTGFLTWDQFDMLGERLGLEWRFDEPWYGLRWAARPLLSRLRRQREPAAFAIAWARSR